MEVKVRLGPGAIMPTYATDGSAGLDLYVPENFWKRCPSFEDVLGNAVYTDIEIDTGVYVEIPKLHVGLIFIRSSLGFKGLNLSNNVGVIDSDYRGSIKLKFVNTNGSQFYNNEGFENGRRVAQLVIVPCPKIELKQVKRLTTSKRGRGGIGSTGK